MTSGSAAAVSDRRLLPLSAGALGVVYGDIGTSPLYALRACFLGEHSVSPTGENVLGVLRSRSPHSAGARSRGRAPRS